MAPKNNDRRKGYIVDRPKQMAVVFSLLGAMGLVVVWSVASILVLPSAAYFEGASGERVRMLLVQIIAAFFLINAVAVSFLAIVMTHRIFGPEFVLRRAVKGMMAGDFSQRTELRRRDMIQDLASDLGSLSSHLADREARLAESRELLREALDGDDLGRAQEALRVMEALARTEEAPSLAGAS